MFAPLLRKPQAKSGFPDAALRTHSTAIVDRPMNRSWDFTTVPTCSTGQAGPVAAASAGRAYADGAGPACSGCPACQGAAEWRDAPGGGGANAPAPAPAPAAPAAAKRTLNVYPVSLPGSTRDAIADISRADAIWKQCSVAISLSGGESWVTDALDKEAPNGVLNECTDVATPTVEELALLDHRPGGASAVHAYYVPSLARSRGETFVPSAAPTPQAAVVIGDNAVSDTLAHELGHVLMNDGSHPADPDNLMATGSARNVGVDKLTAAQCAKT